MNKDNDMHAIQNFPAVNIEALSNGLFRLEDDSPIDGSQVIDLHPAQVQVLASMVGFAMPDKTRRSIGRIHERVKALSEQASDLEDLLDHALTIQDLDVTPEWKACQFIALNLAQVVKDLDDLRAPDLEPAPDAIANPGGQMTLPV
ncbi:hypothetical protein [Aquabacterium sp.]|uniref:hypothetical protein n=1 Tax=Aquabacterium sp. TaxID=1872578 RepID=UPI00248728A4|nr:hypothetical protein [Aquabacterium sp.]MDI1259590.1 hypothetical protein [Aquabacterium sp.]